MTLKELFIANESYIVGIDINEEYYLFCEGLDKNGCTNVDLDNFDINNIKNLCLELFKKNSSEYIETIDSYGIDLTETVDILKEKTLNLISGDYIEKNF